jgi:hypothetical protein
MGVLAEAGNAPAAVNAALIVLNARPFTAPVLSFPFT